MIELYTLPTANGQRVQIALEEFAASYEVRPIGTDTATLRAESFLRVSPYGRLPAIIDRNGAAEPVHVAETGAILWYLAEKYQRFGAGSPAARTTLLQWLFILSSNVAPSFRGQYHFCDKPDRTLPGACAHFRSEAQWALSALERRLGQCAYLAGDEYSIVDMHAYPTVVTSARRLRPDILGDFPRLEAWAGGIGRRPAVIRGMSLAPPA